MQCNVNVFKLAVCICEVNTYYRLDKENDFIKFLVLKHCEERC